MKQDEFTAYIQRRGRELYRAMPWRDDVRPYYILVSEIMLQQTQVSRVVPKFTAFIARFPDITSLARAPLSEVLTLWSGLGYNRRAKFLHQAAQHIVTMRHGEFPQDMAGLLALPGVGKNTAGAILVYAYNQPAYFIETNIRTVYLHHFFADVDQVDDTQLYELLLQTVPQDSPREFYWALMDYGTYLKASGVRNIAKSRHYRKQSPLEGSHRQMRGKLVAYLVAQGGVAEKVLYAHFAHDTRLPSAIDQLVQEGLVTRRGRCLYLTK